jgi:hypothetical protein
MAARTSRNVGRKAGGGKKTARKKAPRRKKLAAGKTRKKKAKRKKAPSRKAAPKKAAKKKARGKQAARKTARKKKASPKTASGRETSTDQPMTKKRARKKAPRRATPRVRARVRSEEEAATIAQAIDRETHPAEIASRHPIRIGTVRHYYAHVNAAIVDLSQSELHVGDVVHFRGHTTDFYERVEKLEVEEQSAEVARAGHVVGIQVTQSVRENDEVFLLSI